MIDANSVIHKLETTHNATDEELLLLMGTDYDASVLFEAADRVRKQVYAGEVYIRGLIEISNHCRNNCLYCGIRASNTNVCRYRLTKEQILGCCAAGYELGFRTFVLQGGEDAAFDDDTMCDIIEAIKAAHPNCAVTLSIGEKSRQSYKRFFDAGADRYLLRHETADEEHYASLHPPKMKLEARKQCLFDLKDIGYQVGSGFMVGSPGQMPGHLLADLRFLQELKPDMIGIGPFISHKDTPFANCANGSVDLTVKLVAILRLLFPHALIPATTALGTIAADGRQRALTAGANVVMPNLSPQSVRELYSLYDNKAHTGAEAAESLAILKKQVSEAGYEVVVARGDVKK